MKNLKVKALAILAGWTGAVFATVATIQLLAKYFGSEFVINLAVSGVMLWLIYQLYKLILTQLEWTAKVDELNKDKQ